MKTKFNCGTRPLKNTKQFFARSHSATCGTPEVHLKLFQVTARAFVVYSLHLRTPYRVGMFFATLVWMTFPDAATHGW
jgi:uncharacterized membrane protein YbhN (UPF0104 family)